MSHQSVPEVYSLLELGKLAVSHQSVPEGQNFTACLSKVNLLCPIDYLWL